LTAYRQKSNEKSGLEVIGCHYWQCELGAWGPEVKRMIRKTGLYISLIVLALVYTKPLEAATINAATCSQSDVQTALKSSHQGDTVVIPAGTCTWASTLSYTAPGSITIIGAGDQSVTGGGDRTVIIDHVDHSSGDPATWSIITGAAATMVRLSGITIKQDSGSNSTFNGILRLYGNSQNVRIDHMHFIVSARGAAAVMDGWMYGVLDHNLLDLGSNTVNNGIRVGHVNWNNQQFGDGSWADDTSFGSNRFIFFEDNIFNGGFANDANNGGRIVFRHNKFNLSEFQVHEMTIRQRATRAWEVYANTWTCDPSQLDCGDSALFVRGGTGLVWGNTANNIKNFIVARNDRTNLLHGFENPPKGWGYCGATYGPTNWDQNTDSTGYACIDQIGRGKGDLLPKSDWPVTPSWPHQALEPIYEWNNALTFAPTWGGVMFVGDVSINENRDYYIYKPTFDGTSGVGSGLFSARPASCAPKVAYWATDRNTLYQCSAADTWTPYYTPYTYPHPLQGS